MPKPTPKATSKVKATSITDFFKKKPGATANKSKEDDNHDDDDFQETDSSSSKLKVSIPETKVKVKAEEPKVEEPKAKTVSKTEPKSQPKVEAKPTTTKSNEKRKRKIIMVSDSESGYEDNKDDDNDKFSEEEEDDVDEEEEDYEEEEEEKEEVKPVKKQVKKKPTASSSSSSSSSKPKNVVKKEEEDKKTVKTEEEESNDKPTFSKAKSFRDMLNRAPPKALGSRPEPQGKPNCLANKTFVFSGQFDTLTKEKVKDVIMRYGGRLTSAVSGKTNYLLRGRDAGESKTKKAESLGTIILDEDGFYDLIEGANEQKVDIPIPPSTPTKGKKRATEEEIKKENNTTTSSRKPAPLESSLLWTDKYKPQTLSEIIGNKEIVNRISQWVADWKTNYNKGFPDSLGDMFSKRALLLSGPPGIGKSTTAGLVAKENGFEAVEFNASDVRSKKVLEATLSEMIDNRSMTEFFQASNGGDRSIKKQKIDPESSKLLRSKKVLLIMDEVDGMSSGDRGGAVELATLIKKTKIPIICICNDIRSQKVQPLLKVCADVRFRRTPANQIRSRIMSIAYKEKLGLQPNAIDELVSATQNDIRQIINILSTYRLSKNQMAYDDAKKIGKSNSKNSQIGLFEIPGALLNVGAWREKKLEEKSEIYFYDYDRADLMIMENYLKTKPIRAEEMSKTGNPKEIACNELDLLAKASEAIAEGDYISAQIHGTVQQYSLMPVHSILSCVRPASFAYGHLKGRIDFPAWLGKNSSTTKYAKLLNDIQARMSRNSSADKYETREYYIPVLSARIFDALEKEDYDTAIQIMDEYDLNRENIDTISELQLPSSTKGPITKLPTKVKSTFTRQYNRTHHDTIFHEGGAAIKKTTSGPKEDLVGTIVAEEESEEPEDEQVDELEELKKSNELKVITSVKGATGGATKKRKATATGAGASKKRSKK